MIEKERGKQMAFGLASIGQKTVKAPVYNKASRTYEQIDVLQSPRVFRIKPSMLGLDIIPLRGSLETAARKLGVQINQLISFGISDKGIDRKALINQAKNKSAMSSIFLRKGETRNVENLSLAIIGRIGDVSGYLELAALPEKVKIRGVDDAKEHAQAAYGLALELELASKAEEDFISMATEQFYSSCPNPRISQEEYSQKFREAYFT